ncbi:MAG TPA: ParB/RepB/Spo0J family partition protein [Pseudomonadales bacterium]
MAAPTLSEITYLPVKELTTSADNVRKSKATPEEDAELRAGIKAVGVLNPLLVKENAKGKSVVVAGGRRLAALQQLIKEKTLPADYAAPCIILDPEADAVAIGLIENGQRAGMHPIDEFEAYHELHFKKHLTVDDIAAQHGKTPLEVKKRLALGGVHPDIRADCRSGALNIDVLDCYATTTDQQKQLKIYQTLKKQKQHNWRHYVVQAFAAESYSTKDDIVKFIGIETYKDAGGAIDEDLFAEDSGGVELRLLDCKLVESLALTKLEAAAIKHGKGWKWAKAELEFSLYNMPYSRIHAEKGGFTAQQKQESGIVVTIQYGGRLEVHKGLVRKEDERAAKSATKKAKAAKAGAAVSGALGDEPAYSAALKHDLADHKLAATKLALLDLADPALLVSAMHFAICNSVLNQDDYEGAIGMAMECKPTQIFMTPVGRSIENDLEEMLEKHRADLLLDWLDEPTTAAQFRAFLKLSDGEQRLQVAYCAALMLKHTNIDTNPGPDMMLAMVGANLANYWRPTADNFFSRIPQAERLRIVANVLCENEAPAAQKKMKAAELSKYLEDKVAAMPAADRWMPEGFDIQEPTAAATKLPGKKVKRSAASAAAAAAALADDDEEDDYDGDDA